MNKSLSIALALVAGLAGGLLTRYIAPPTVFAQNQAPVPKEIRAQSFTLVDQAGRAAGTFTFDPDNWNNRGGRIVLRDSGGEVIWSASAGAVIRPLSENIR
jgi:hypothetical protein